MLTRQLKLAHQNIFSLRNYTAWCCVHICSIKFMVKKKLLQVIYNKLFQLPFLITEADAHQVERSGVPGILLVRIQPVSLNYGQLLLTSTHFLDKAQQQNYQVLNQVL